MRLCTLCLSLTLCVPLCFVPAQPVPAGGGQLPKKAQADRLDGDGEPLPPGGIARLGTRRWRGLLGRLAYSPDGKTLASVGFGTILFDAKSGLPLREIKQKGQRMELAPRFLPDGKLLALQEGQEGLQRKQLFDLVDVATGKTVQAFDGHPVAVLSGAISADGKLVATGCFEIRLWDAGTGKLLRELPKPKNCTTALAFSPDGKLLAAGEGWGPLDLVREPPDAPAGIRIWDVQTGRLKARLDGHRSSVYDLVFSPDSRRLLSGGDDGSLRLWDMAGAKQLRIAEKVGLRLCTLSPDGKVLAGWSGWRISFWDVARWEDVTADDGHADGVETLVFAPGGTVLASLGRDHTVRLWDVRGGKQVHKFTGHRPTSSRSRDTCPLAFSSDGRLVTAGNPGGRVTVREVATGAEVRQFRPTKEEGEGAYYQLLLGGSVLAVGRSHGVQLWDVKSGKLLQRLDIPKGELSCRSLAASADGRVVAAGCDSGAVYLWSPVTGKLLWRLAAKNSEPQVVVGATAAVALAFSADGRYLAAAYNNSDVRLWELASGGEAKQIRLPESAHPARHELTLAFSPDLRHFAVVDPTGTRDALLSEHYPIALWDTAAGKERRRLPGHVLPVDALAFSADGKILASGGWDTSVLLWDVSAITRREKPAAVALSPRELERLWADLAGKDATQAYQALKRLAGAPSQAVEFLRQRLGPVPVVDSEQIARLIAYLDHEEYARREKAARELERWGELAEPDLRKALERPLSLEVRRRVERLVARLEADRLDPPAARLQSLRAVAVLEDIGTAGASQVLTKLAGGARGARLTQEAQASLGRLAERPGNGP
jgi:WD40 repeat protein